MTEKERIDIFNENKALVDFVLVKQLHLSTQNMLYLDARQQGYIKLLHCIDCYDWENSQYAFSTFATTALYRHLRLFITQEKVGIKVCSQDVTDINIIADADMKGEKTGLTKKRELYVRDLFAKRIEIDRVIDEDNDEILGNKLPDSFNSIKNYDTLNSLLILIEHYKKGKSESVKRVIDTYCNKILNNSDDCTAMAVAKELGLTRQRVSVILKQFKETLSKDLLRIGMV